MSFINIFDSLLNGGEFWKRIHHMNEYRHTINADGGYWSARFTMPVRGTDIDMWVQAGLGKHVEVSSSTLDVYWIGFINKISVNYGPVVMSHGPLMDIANRVDLVYSAIDTTTTPPTTGIRLKTGFANDTDSQEKFGIITKVLSTGGVDEENAGEGSRIRDLFLDENKYPSTSNRWSTESTSPGLLTVECLGYIHWLNYAYNNETAGTQNASTKISTVLNGTYNPNNSWLPFDTSGIDSNTIQVGAWENEDKIALDVIKKVVAQGDASNNRWLFAVYGTAAEYKAIPTSIDYLTRLSDPKLKITTTDGGKIEKWNVLPGKWLMFTDFITSYVSNDVDFLREDPRVMFIESVSFMAPDTLRLTGGTTDTLAQYISRLGLSGVGA